MLLAVETEASVRDQANTFVVLRAPAHAILAVDALIAAAASREFKNRRKRDEQGSINHDYGSRARKRFVRRKRNSHVTDTQFSR